MINLLPPEEKDKISADVRIKVLKIFWFLILFFILCLIAFFGFINLYVKIQLDGQIAQISQHSGASPSAVASDLKKNIDSLNSDLSKINEFYGKKIYFSEILDKISQIMPENVYFANLSIIKGKNGTKISVSGFAPSREELLELKKNLDKESDYFKDVSFPQSDWVKPHDIDFFISFSLAI